MPIECSVLKDQQHLHRLIHKEVRQDDQTIKRSNDFPRHGKLHDEKRSGEDGRMLGLRSIEVVQVECRLSSQFLQAKVGGLSPWSWRETGEAALVNCCL